MRTFLLLSLATLAAAAQAPSGALDGREIVISPGHGYYWHATLGWTTQRGLIDGLIEDVHTHEIVHDHLLPWLEGTGARTVLCRARSRTEEEHVIQDDSGPSNYSETGAWTLSTGFGFGATTYRFAGVAPVETARATFRTTVTRRDVYPVYLAWRAGANRAPDVEVTIVHAAGVSTRTVDQTRHDRRWVHLGDFPFDAMTTAEVRISNRSTVANRVVIADAVKIGDGLGTEFRGGTRSGQPRWLEASRYHARYFGAPASVYDTAGADNADDVTCRPRYGEWFTEGRGDLFLSIHTNAGGGQGTSSFIYNGGATPGSSTWQNVLHTEVVNAIRSEWDPTWTDRGQRSANFGELRLLSSMPGALIELAFHDDIGGDIEAIHHPRWRAIVGRAMAQAIVRQLAPGAPDLPDVPDAIQARNIGEGRIQVRWRPITGASFYLVESSPDGFAWDAGTMVSGTELVVSGQLARGMRHYRVRAGNAAGTTPPSVPVVVRTSPFALSPVLLVDGFDRRDRRHKEAQNPRDWQGVTGGIAAAIAAYGLPFDGATNEAVRSGLATLTPYDTVIWSLGNESTVDETLDAVEQFRVSFYLQRGGKLLLSGAEIGWDLGTRGSAADQAFLANDLGVRMVADDAGTYLTRPVTTGPLAPLPTLLFSNGSDGRYDVAFPDVLEPALGSGGQTVLQYSDGRSAAVLSANGRVFVMGFPLERLVSPSGRAALLEHVLGEILDLPLRATISTSPAPTVDLELDLPGMGTAPYAIAAALSAEPVQALPGGGSLPLAADPLFALSLDPAFAFFFPGFLGALDASGNASTSLPLPPGAGLSGVRLHFAAAALAPGSGALATITPDVSVVLP